MRDFYSSHTDLWAFELWRLGSCVCASLSLSNPFVCPPDPCSSVSHSLSPSFITASGPGGVFPPGWQRPGGTQRDGVTEEAWRTLFSLHLRSTLSAAAGSPESDSEPPSGSWMELITGTFQPERQQQQQQEGAFIIASCSSCPCFSSSFP